MYILKVILGIVILMLVFTYLNTTFESFKGKRYKKYLRQLRKNTEPTKQIPNDSFKVDLTSDLGEDLSLYPKAKQTEKGIITEGSFEQGESVEHAFLVQLPWKPGVKDLTFVETFDVSTDISEDIIIGGIEMTRSRIPNIPGNERIVQHVNVHVNKLQEIAEELKDDFWKRANSDPNIGSAGIENGFKMLYFKPTKVDEKSLYSPKPVSFFCDKHICVARVLFRPRNNRWDFIVKIWCDTFEESSHLGNDNNQFDFGGARFTWHNLNDTAEVETYGHLEIEFHAKKVAILENYKRKGYGRFYNTSWSYYPYPNQTITVPRWDNSLMLSYNHETKLIKGVISRLTSNGEPTNDVITPTMDENGLSYTEATYDKEKLNFMKHSTNDFSFTINYSNGKPIINVFVNGIIVGNFKINDNVPFDYACEGLIMSARKANKTYGDIYISNIAARQYALYMETLTSEQLGKIYYENMTDTEKLENCEENVEQIEYDHEVDLMIENVKLDTVKQQRDGVQDIRITEKMYERDELEEDEYNSQRKVHHIHKKYKKFKFINMVQIIILCLLILIALVGLALKYKRIRDFFKFDITNFRLERKPTFGSTREFFKDKYDMIRDFRLERKPTFGSTAQSNNYWGR